MSFVSLRGSISIVSTGAAHESTMDRQKRIGGLAGMFPNSAIDARDFRMEANALAPHVSDAIRSSAQSQEQQEKVATTPTTTI